VGGINHVGISVASVARAQEFFTRHLDFVVEDSWSSGAAYLSDLLGYPGVSIRGAMLVSPSGDQRIELLEYPERLRRRIDHGHANPGTVHLAFEVPDVRATYDRLVAAGVTAVSEPVAPTTGANRGRDLVYVIGPDGVRIELMGALP
jgi:catechol 2,3-dioxygenase-like lactoylglutathione lyase family enzyme